jgi:squalene-associated FAD-dependent desaturase
LVLGGGVAGLVAAFGLADRGFAVTLFESRGWLGGRAFSPLDRRSGRRLDNGPHVMLGCYRATRALLRRLGTEAGFQQDESLALAWRRRGGGRLRLALSRWPVPLAMPLALGRLPIPVGARWRALRGMLGTLWPTPAHWTLADWLARRGQRGEPEALLWRPLCRAIMNVEPELAGARAFLATLREAFGGGASRAGFWVPRRPWGELLGDAAGPALAAAGIGVRCTARVRALDAVHGRVGRVAFDDGTSTSVGEHDVVVSALPWRALRAVLPALPAGIGELASSPIVSAYVTLPPSVPPLPEEGPVTALVDGEPFHFVLRTPGDDPRHLALLAGGSRAFDGMAVEAIAARALAQLAAWYPEASLTGSEVCVRKEQHATFVAGCGSEQARPAPGRLAGGPANLLVCGDWTATGLPATLEGAARSAERMLLALRTA